MSYIKNWQWECCWWQEENEIKTESEIKCDDDEIAVDDGESESDDVSERGYVNANFHLGYCSIKRWGYPMANNGRKS